MEELVTITQVVANVVVAATLILVLRQLRQGLNAARLQAWLNLFAGFDEINAHIARNPSDAKSLLPYPEMETKGADLQTLFLHVNLMFRYWQFRKTWHDYR